MRDRGIRESTAASDVSDARTIDPGKHTRTEAVQRTASPPADAPPVLATASPGADLSFLGLFGVDLDADTGGAFGHGKGKGTAAAAPAGPAPADPLKLADVDVDVPWNAKFDPVLKNTGQSVRVHSGKIFTAGGADLKPDATVDGAYTLGFVQTLVHTRRDAIYAEDQALDDAHHKRADKVHADINKQHKKAGKEWDSGSVTEIEEAHDRIHIKAPEYERLHLAAGPMLDTLVGPAPWYDASQNYTLGTPASEASIADHPFVEAPIKNPDGKATLTRLEGKDSFLTNLIAMPAGGGTPVFLAWATWESGWNGELDASRYGFHGGSGGLTGEGKGKGGAPVLTGSPANTLGGTATWSGPKK